MKVLIVTQYFFPEDFRVNDLAISLQNKLGHEVTVLTALPNYPQGNFFKNFSLLGGPYTGHYQGIKVYRVPIVPRGKNSKLQLALNYFSYALMASLMGPFLCRGQYDIIFVAQYSPVTVGLPGIMMKWVKRAPLYLWVQDLWPESLSATGAIRSRSMLQLVAKLVRYIYSHCDRILVQSQAFIPYIKREAGSAASIHYLPNWAESLYQPVVADQGLAEEKGLPAGFRIMFAGNIGVAQDFETILSAAERLRQYPEIHWVVLGDGRARVWVEQEIDRRKLTTHIHIMGRHPMEEMPSFFSLADAMLVTLKKEPIFALTIPSKVQSYLACGRPILAAIDGEGSRIVTEAQAGLTCCAEDPEQLAAIVLQLFNMTSEERDAMGNRGRYYYEEHYDRKRLIAKLNEWFGQVQGKRGV